jgi:serine O-acetyltransferase
MIKKVPGLLAQIRMDINCVFERDPAARTKFEVVTTYPGVHAIIMHRIAHRLWQKNWQYLARLIAYFVRIWTNVDIHPGAKIGQGFFIDHGAGVVIGETAEIGNNVTIYHGVTLGGTTWSKGKRHPTLEDNVMVGAGAKVLGAVTIGKNVNVGANSVVVKDVPAGSSVVGIPGRVVQAEPREVDNPYGINLHHHLIPDPVGKAVSCLMQRLHEVETELAIVKKQQNCETSDKCIGEDVCGPNSSNNLKRAVVKS